MAKQILHKLQAFLRAGSKEDDVGADQARIAAAARLLQISDFDFFRLSFTRWYGKDLSEKEAEQPFAGYLQDGTVPFWARHSARQVLSRYRSGELDPGDFNVRGPLPPREDPAQGRNVTLLMVLFYGLLFLFMSGYIFRQ